MYEQKNFTLALEKFYFKEEKKRKKGKKIERGEGERRVRHLLNPLENKSEPCVKQQIKSRTEKGKKISTTNNSPAKPHDTVRMVTIEKGKPQL